MRLLRKVLLIGSVALLVAAAASSLAYAQLREQPELLRRLWPFGRQPQRPVAQLAEPAIIANRPQPLVAPFVARKIDINACTLSELQDLPGVGPSLGARIMAGRPYRSFEDLERIDVPLNVVARLRGVVTFGR